MKIIKYILLLFLLILLSYFIFLQKRYPFRALVHSFQVGDSTDSFNGVTVYNNGLPYETSHGRHYNADSSFYYGKKWQCVEFIKRYYFDHLHFSMPDGSGNAKDFYDLSLASGSFSAWRGLWQFANGSSMKPCVDDILVFGGKFGHVAIVTSATDDEIEVIQQNIYMSPRERFLLDCRNGCYTIGTTRKPEGWLRLIRTH